MNVALAVLAVVTGITAARILGPSGEGELTAIQTWPLLLGTLAMLGLDSALVYFIARQPEKGKQFTSTAIAHRSPLILCSCCCSMVYAAIPSISSATTSCIGSARRSS